MDIINHKASILIDYLSLLSYGNSSLTCEQCLHTEETISFLTGIKKSHDKSLFCFNKKYTHKLCSTLHDSQYLTSGLWFEDDINYIYSFCLS